MPQLDTAAFLPQIFWLVLIFTIFYLVALNNVIPMVSRILKVRFKKLSQGQEIITLTDNFNKTIRENSSNLLSKVSQTSGGFLLDTLNVGRVWLDKQNSNELSANAVNSKVKIMNTAFLKTAQQLATVRVFSITK